MSVVVVATIRPLPEHRDEVIAEFSATIAQVHDEDGCELYALNQADDRLIMIEKWASPEALATHSKAANLAALNPKVVVAGHKRVGAADEPDLWVGGEEVGAGSGDWGDGGRDCDWAFGVWACGAGGVCADVSGAFAGAI